MNKNKQVYDALLDALLDAEHRLIAVKEILEAPKWLPIKEAPKDGTSIMVRATSNDNTSRDCFIPLIVSWCIELDMWLSTKELTDFVTENLKPESYWDADDANTVRFQYLPDPTPNSKYIRVKQ